MSSRAGVRSASFCTTSWEGKGVSGDISLNCVSTFAKVWNPRPGVERTRPSGGLPPRTEGRSVAERRPRRPQHGEEEGRAPGEEADAEADGARGHRVGGGAQVLRLWQGEDRRASQGARGRHEAGDVAQHGSRAAVDEAQQAARLRARGGPAQGLLLPHCLHHRDGELPAAGACATRPDAHVQGRRVLARLGRQSIDAPAAERRCRRVAVGAAARALGL